MPVVSVPEMLLDRSVTNQTWIDVRVHSRVDRDIYHELANRFPSLKRLLVGEDGEPRWTLALIRDTDGEDLRYWPAHLLDDDERLTLLSMVGC